MRVFSIVTFTCKLMAKGHMHSELSLSQTLDSVVMTSSTWPELDEIWLADKNHTLQTITSKSKPEVEFQYGAFFNR